MAKQQSLKSDMKISFLILALVFATTTYAQDVRGINYQAVIKDVSGLPLSDKLVSFKFSLIKGSATIYAERHEITTNADGLVNLVIGKGTSIGGVFSSIDWSGEQVKVKVELDKNGGNNFEELGTTTLASVPYAFYAEKAKLDLIGHGLIVDGNHITARDSSSTNEIQFLELNGTTLKITNGNEVILPTSTPIPMLDQTALDATEKYKGLYVWNTTNKCLYIYDNPPYYFKWCGFTCLPSPDQANAGADIVSDEQPFILSGNVPSSGSVTWQIISGTGGAISNPNSPTTTFTGSLGQSYQLRYSITNNCGTNTDDKIINVVESTNVSDFEGNQYPIATLGTQTWIVPNIMSTKYADGTDIPFSYPNNNVANKETYGLLYTPSAILKNDFTPGTQGLCPNDYHIPTEAELLTLFNFLESNPLNYSLFYPIKAGQGSISGVFGFDSFNLVATSTLSGNLQGLYFYAFSTGSHTFFSMPLTSTEGISVRCIKN